MDYKYISKEAEDTIELAQNIESEKFPNMLICLNGDLGSGKTLFVKGFASALGIDDNITSPTFNIVKEYSSGELKFNHIDAYRIEDDIETLGINDYFNTEGVTIIEWAENIEEHLPKERIDINFNIIDENSRVLTLIPHGEKYIELCNSVL